jgi:hypothetical protein
MICKMYGDVDVCRVSLSREFRLLVKFRVNSTATIYALRHHYSIIHLETISSPHYQLFILVHLSFV